MAVLPRFYTLRRPVFHRCARGAALLAAAGVLACGSASAPGDDEPALAMREAVVGFPGSEVRLVLSSELKPRDPIWFTEPPAESEITYRLSEQLPPLVFTQSAVQSVVAALQAPASAYAIEAEIYSDHGDVSGQPIQFGNGGQTVGFLDGGGTGVGNVLLPGDWMRYDGVDFDRVGTYLSLQVGRGSSEPADMAVWADARTVEDGGTLLAKVPMTATPGAWEDYQPHALTDFDKQGLTGTHPIFLVCEGAGGTGNIDYITFTQPPPPAPPTTPLVIQVDPDQKFQRLLGIGTSLEDTTVYAILKNKTDDQRRAILKDLLDPATGIGLNLIRITIGTSDFSDGRSVAGSEANPNGWYTYQDDGPDSPFSIANDKNLYSTDALSYPGGLVAALKLAQQVAAESGNELTFFASPWTPPAWMKNPSTLVGMTSLGQATLKEGFEPQLAQYLRNFVMAYEAEGIPIHAITLQNERNFTPTAYPGMLLSDQQEADLVEATYENFHNIGGDHGPELHTGLWILDHNFDQVGSAIAVMDLLAAKDKTAYVDAAAFHHYGGDPSQMTQFSDRYPATDLVFTEGAVWGVGSTSGNGASFQEVVKMFRNGARSYVDWVTMVTHDSTEHIQGPFSASPNLSPVLLMSAPDDVGYIRTPEFFMLGQFSRYIKPGAVRIASGAGTPDRALTVAFLNPDNQVVLVAVNASDFDQGVTIAYRGWQVTGTVPKKAVGTFLWNDSSLSGSGGGGGIDAGIDGGGGGIDAGSGGGIDGGSGGGIDGGSGGGIDGGSGGGIDGGIGNGGGGGGIDAGGGGDSGGGCRTTGEGSLASVLALGLVGLLRPRRARTAR